MYLHLEKTQYLLARLRDFIIPFNFLILYFQVGFHIYLFIGTPISPFKSNFILPHCPLVTLHKFKCISTYLNFQYQSCLSYSFSIFRPSRSPQQCHDSRNAPPIFHYLDLIGTSNSRFMMNAFPLSTGLFHLCNNPYDRSPCDHSLIPLSGFPVQISR